MNIRSIRTGDHKLLGQIIGKSFEDDPVNTFLLGPRPAITAYNIHVAKHLYLKKGFGHIAEDHSGASMWLPAGVPKHIPLWKSGSMIASLIKHNGLRHMLKALPAEDEIASHHPKDPFYYLYAIGNTPAGQGKGLGKKLMEAGLKVVDKAGLPAYLECSKESNISFYQRFNFEVVGKCFPVEGCPPQWLMLRPAKASLKHTEGL